MKRGHLKIKKNFNSQRGAVSILLAVLLLSQLLIISLGLGLLIIRQIKMSSQAGQSVVAFYAADAGAEKCLYQTRCILVAVPTPECLLEAGPGLDQGCASVGGVISGTFALSMGNATYQATRQTDTSITSIGQFGGASRKVELTW